MIEFILLFINLFFIGIILFNPILFLYSNQNNKIQKKYLNSYLISIVILLNFFLFFSHFDLFNINNKIFFNSLIILTIFISAINYKKLFKSSYVIDLPVIVLITLFLSINIFSNTVLGWDGNFWIEKAKIFFEDSAFNNLKKTIFPNYPHLGAYIWGFFWKNSFISSEVIGRLSFILIYVLSIYNLCGYYNSSNFNKIIFTLLSIFLTYKFSFFTGYQDNLIFSLTIISIILMMSYFETKNLRYLVVVNFSMFLVLWFKNEGLIAYILLLFMFFIFKEQKIPKNHLILFTLLSILLLLIRIFYFIKLNNSLVFQDGISLINFFSNLSNPAIFFEKFYLIIKYFFIKIFHLPIFIFFCLTILIIKKITKKELVFLTIVIVFYSSPYLFSSYGSDFERLIWHLKTSYDRLLFQCSAFFLFITIKNLSENIKYK